MVYAQLNPLNVSLKTYHMQLVPYRMHLNILHVFWSPFGSNGFPYNWLTIRSEIILYEIMPGRIQASALEERPWLWTEWRWFFILDPTQEALWIVVTSSPAINSNRLTVIQTEQNEERLASVRTDTIFRSPFTVGSTNKSINLWMVQLQRDGLTWCMKVSNLRFFLVSLVRNRFSGGSDWRP